MNMRNLEEVTIEETVVLFSNDIIIKLLDRSTILAGTRDGPYGLQLSSTRVKF